MPIYNAANYLKPALDSVLSQTLSEIEVICIDDGSTDSSLEIIKNYQESDERVRIVTETNAGPALARNNGIKRARGKYISFLDADDFLEPTFLEALYVASEEGNLDIAIANYDIYNSRKARFEDAREPERTDVFTSERVTSKNEHPDSILSSTTGAAWNKLFRRTFVEEKGLAFLTDVKTYEDVYFVACAMSLAERVGKVHKVLVHHRIHSEQSRARFLGKYYSHVPVVYQKIKEFLMQHGMYAPLLKSYLNLSAGRCYKIFNLLSGDSKKSLWDMLHTGYAELLGWQGRESSDFEKEEVYAFTAFVQLYSFEEYNRKTIR